MLGLAAAFGIVLPTMLPAGSNAVAQTAGMERREERRDVRHERREDRREGRQERRDTRQEGREERRDTRHGGASDSTAAGANGTTGTAAPPPAR